MEELQESELGSQEYWDNRYSEEVDNFESHGDVGEIWFGEDIVRRIIKWIKNHNSIPKEANILDLGCGNGMFLIELAKEGYTNLIGVDYSEGAINLAKSIAQQENVQILYSTCDILEKLEGQYDFIHDKGTYDAISLNANAAEFRGKYIVNLQAALNEGSYFMITSCNWTKSELDSHFEQYFEGVDIVPTPHFKFGGQTGNVVTTVIYKKRCK